GNPGPVEFEAALCVADVPQADDQVHGNLEAPGTDAAIPLLRVFDPGLEEGAGAEYDVEAVLEPGEDLLDLVDGRLVVGVHKADDFAAGPHHGVANGAALAAALGVAQHAHAVVHRGEAGYFLTGVVVAVGRDQDFVVIP